ncbi:aerotolerance regulator BatD [Leptospira stimsonii]|uniref:Aerotolerance regulator BatD n=1 Tax=Leptospira stimsonii TaxID=2202203 RepID=A0ABY2N1V0_9LEPT|nr:BatD family protein [Leptospira stimsonii]TGK20638.1 aerotolerance regulator BatD [Leptospira stimsonii]TGM14426.1 aerotolerance regulator BatD [Leptospira stimsonii]
MVKRILTLFLFFGTFTLSAEETKFYVTRNMFHLGEESYAVFEMDLNSKYTIPQNSFSNGDVTVFYSGIEENTTIINFQVFRKRLLKFRIKPTKQGTFALPPLSIEVNGKTFTPGAVQVQVLARAQTAKSRGGSFFDRFFQFEGEDLPDNADLRVLFQTSKKQAWIGEPIIGYFTLYFRDVRKPYFDRNPADSIQFPYFRSEVLSGVAVKIPEQILYEGNVYDVAVYNKEIYSLIPLRPGDFYLGKTTFSLEGQLQSYFNVKTVSTIPNLITVRPLPKYDGNFSGGVGKFKAQVRIKNDPRDEVAVGDTLYLTVIIEGEGNLSSVSDPFCSEGKDCFPQATLYDTHRSWKFTELENSGYEFYSTAKFEYGIPMTKKGIWKEESKVFVYFDPDSGSYKNAILEFPSIEVLGESKRKKTPLDEKIKEESAFVSPKRILFLSFGFLILLAVCVSIWIRWKKTEGAREIFDWIPGIFWITGGPVLKELDLLVGSKRGLVLKQSLLSKGISESDASFLANISRTESNFVEITRRLNSDGKKNLLRIAQAIVKKLKEET